MCKALCVLGTSYIQKLGNGLLKDTKKISAEFPLFKELFRGRTEWILKLILRPGNMNNIGI